MSEIKSSIKHKFKSVPIKVSVHLEGRDPIFGDGVTHISIENDGSGPFFDFFTGR